MVPPGEKVHLGDFIFCRGRERSKSTRVPKKGYLQRNLIFVPLREIVTRGIGDDLRTVDLIFFAGDNAEMCMGILYIFLYVWVYSCNAKRRGERKRAR